MLQNSMKSWDLMEGFGRYQRAAARTMPKLPKRDMLNMLALGLAGESGEVVDAIKKHLYHGHELPKSKVVDELGDVAWYLVNLCTLFDIDLSQVIEFNIAKLLDRYPDGFEPERSINRVELRESDGQVGGVRMGPTMQEAEDALRRAAGRVGAGRYEWDESARMCKCCSGAGVRLYPGTTIDDLIESEHPQTYGTDIL